MTSQRHFQAPVRAEVPLPPEQPSGADPEPGDLPQPDPPQPLQQLHQPPCESIICFV